MAAKEWLGHSWFEERSGVGHSVINFIDWRAVKKQTLVRYHLSCLAFDDLFLEFNVLEHLVNGLAKTHLHDGLGYSDHDVKKDPVLGLESPLRLEDK